jgi:A/G-specific adenine glycosylase
MVEAASIEEARALLVECGVDLRASLQPAGQVRHILTHRTLDVIVARAVAPSRWRPKKPASPPYERTAWFDPEDAQVGISTLARKVLACTM